MKNNKINRQEKKILNELLSSYTKQINNNEINELTLAKKIFARWLKKRKLWTEYKANLIQNGHNTFMNSWNQPDSIIDLSGCNNFEYDKVFIPWSKFCRSIMLKQRKHEE